MNRVSESFVRSKMAISLELKPCLSNFSREIERQNEGYQGTSITLIFTRLVVFFFNALIFTDFR